MYTQKEKTEVAEPRRDSGVVLVVDDNLELLCLVKQVLTAEGFKVLTAPSVDAAFRTLAATTPDMIICDVLLPDKNGLEFHREVKQSPEWCNVPFVFLTGLSSEEHIRIGKQQGCDDYLTKPVEVEDLIAVVKGKLALAEHRRKMALAQFEGYRKRIIHTLSHEFRTPLVSINTGTELLLDQHGDLPHEQIKRLLESIWRGGQRLERLVNDFMLLQQIDLGHARQTYELYKQPISVLQLIETAVDCFNQTAFEGHVAEPEVLLPNKRRLEQLIILVYDVQILNVIQRLLSNAYKFAGEESRVTVSGGELEGVAYISIRDRGPGMDSLCKSAPKACEAFVQLKREVYEQQGCGIGLTISRHFAEINGGSLRFCTPEEGPGLEAMLSFPLMKIVDFDEPGNN